MIVRSFCPGHITGFFQIIEHDDPLRSGSRGAGMCISLGARCRLESERGTGKIDVKLDGRDVPAPVTIDAIRTLPGSDRMDYLVRVEHDLPMSQGFGMSAAGAVAASLAASASLGLERDDALRSAHLAELKNRTGLGDVAAISRGGITFRKKEGIPPHGVVDRIDNAPEIVLCVIGRPISTAAAISDPRVRKKINEAGADCVEGLARSPTLDSLMALSKEFMLRTGLSTQEVRKAVETTESADGMASMVMLGNSVFAVGKAKQLEEALRPYGRTFRTKVDLTGPMIL